MLDDAQQFLRGESFDSHREEVSRQNRLAIRYFATAGVPVGIANIVAQTTVKGAASSLTQHGVWLFGYFVFLFLVDRFVIPLSCRRATLLAYVLEAPVLIVTILLGTVWDPEHQAMTFLMFMLAIPIFILDRPIRALGVLVGWNVLFLALCLLVKNPSTWQGDFSHTLEFLLLAISVTYVVLKVRFEVLEAFDRTRYHLEHDALTDTQNRMCFENRIESYVGKQLFVVMGSIDHLGLINDSYGKKRGDEVVMSFADALKHEFSDKNTFRYGGDDMLCLLVGESEEEGVARIAACRQRLSRLWRETFRSALSYSFGYTYATPSSDEALSDMLHLASIYVHQAMSKGEGKTVGGMYSDVALRAGISESSLTGHASSNEINQLTGLPTVPYFVARTEELMNHAELLQQRDLSVGYLNLRDFRGFNDEFGYEQGDELLRYLAQLLHRCLPRRHVAYISGSRFVTLCHTDEIESAMRAIDDALRSYKPGHPLLMQAGFVEYHKGDAIISLIDKAKLAHDNVDDRDVPRFRLYDAELDNRVRLRQHLVSHLDQAIEKGWIRVHYQPIVCTGTGEVCNLEALSRWNDPIYGLLAPADFIGVLENERQIYKLSLHVVRQVLRDFQRLMDEGLSPKPVSINLSRNDFYSCDMVEAIRALVDDAGIAHDMLCFEITESAFVGDQSLLLHEVERLRALGFWVWMDDFGSEYSTLNLLRELNVDVVKIDMRFMEHFSPGSHNAIIVESVLDMCKRLGITTLVEGVETCEQRDLLQEMGCDKLQGYLFFPPLPLADVMYYSHAKQDMRSGVAGGKPGLARVK